METKERQSYARCKACDSPIYPVWYEDLGRYEDLCGTCLEAIFKPDYGEDDFLYWYLSDKGE